MSREPTTILCDGDLKAAAKAAKIVLSTTLEEGLRMKLAMPKNQRDDINLKVRELEAQLEYMKSAEFAAEKLDQEKKERRAIESRKSDDELLRKSFSKKCNQEISSENYNRLLKAYCLKYGVEMVQAVAISQSKKGAEE